MTADQGREVRLTGRGLLTLLDLKPEELMYLLDLAVTLKQRRRQGVRGDLLCRKIVALVFEKSSTRTRGAAVVALSDEGGRSEYLSPGEVHLGKKESIADTARVLGRMFDGIFFRGYGHHTVELLAQHAGIPVWNALTDSFHPTQALADLMTVREHFGRLEGVKFVYLGDGRNNVVNSLMLGCAMTGMELVNCTPRELSPDPAFLKKVQAIAARTGARVSVSHDPREAVQGANVLYTDVWTSMGEEAQFDQRVKLLQPFQVNMDLARRTGNCDKGQLVFLHCLPAFHDSETELTREIGALEVTNDVFEAPFSRVFDQAENRLHTIKALFVATLSDPSRR